MGLSASKGEKVTVSRFYFRDDRKIGKGSRRGLDHLGSALLGTMTRV